MPHRTTPHHTTRVVSCTQLTFKTDGAMDGVSYQLNFSPPTHSDGDVQLLFKDFRPNFRGRPVEAPALKGEDVVQVRRCGGAAYL